MGLFLGCSILTLCEFIDFLWEVIIYRIRKRSVDTTQKAAIGLKNISPDVNIDRFV